MLKKGHYTYSRKELLSFYFAIYVYLYMQIVTDTALRLLHCTWISNHTVSTNYSFDVHVTVHRDKFL